jgi:hypothetical protein
MKHYSTYVVQTTTKPKYIHHVAHTTLHEALQYICSAHNNKAKVHPGTAHRHNQARLRNGTPKFRPSPPLSRPTSVRSSFATPVRPPVATGQPRPRPRAHRERGTVPGAVFPCPQNKLSKAAPPGKHEYLGPCSSLSSGFVFEIKSDVLPQDL